MKASDLELTDQQLERILILLMEGHRIELKRKGLEIEIIKITRKKEK